MLGRGQGGDSRGISEILGTVLVFSFVIIIAFSLVMVGFNVFDDATDDTEKRVGQDTIVEIGDRLGSVSSSTVESATTLSVPRGVGQDLRADSDNGRLLVEVTTTDPNLSVDDIAADQLTNTTEFELGTVAHQQDDGPETVYQGGMVFEREGSTVRILSEPNFNYNGGRLDFSFTGLSDLDSLSEGDELYAERNIDASQERIDEINRIIAEQRTIGNDTDNPIGYAPVSVNLTIQTAYPEAWEAYADRKDMTENSVNVVPRDDSITFGFPSISGSNTTGANFASNVIYTGDHQAAHLYYNDSLGTVGNLGPGGFNVTEVEGWTGIPQLHQDQYGVAVADDDMWKIAYLANQGSSLEWYNVSTEIGRNGKPQGPEVSEPDTLADGPGNGGGGASTDEWEFSDGSIVCTVVNRGQNPSDTTLEDTINSVAEGDCNQGTVTANEDQIPDQSPNFEISNLDTDPSSGDYVTGERFEVAFDVENTGNAYDEQYISLGADLTGNGSYDLADYTRVTLYPGEDTTLDLAFEVTTGLNDDLDARVVPQTGSGGSVGFQYTDQPEFDITDLDSDGTTAPGDRYNVTATIENDGSEEEQTVTLTDSSGTVVDTETVKLGNRNPSSDTTDVELTWDVPLDASFGSGKDLTVETLDDSDTITVEREPAALVEDVSTSVDNSAGTVTVEAEIRNPSTAELTNANVAVEPGDLARSASPSDETVTVSGKSTETVTFDWSLSGDDITDWTTVETADDSGKDVGVVERTGSVPDCSTVSFEGGDGSSGDPYQISNVDQLQCIDEDLDADYELVDDIAAHGTEYWNGGDGFEPIGEQPRNSNSGNAFDDDSTFDGQGNSIVGLTIDRYDEPFVGMFSITETFETSTSDVEEGAMIRDVVLEEIDVRGMTVVGGLVGGGGGQFKRISVDGRVESQYQQVGGIVGHAHDGDLTNELVSTATVIGDHPIVVNGDPSKNHPWQDTTGSPNLGIGGILGGMGYDTEFDTGYSRATVSGPSSVGGITGWTSNNPSDLSQMYWADGTLDLDGDVRVFDETDRKQFTSPLRAGGIAGRIGENNDPDTIFDSVYADGPTVGDGEDNVNDNSISLGASEMTGPQVLPEGKSDSFYDQFPGVEEQDAEGTMANLDWDIWTPVYDVDEDGNIVNEGLPKFQWQVDGKFIVTITDADNVQPGQNNTGVDVTVENTASYRQEQPVTLQKPDGTVVDSQRVELDPGKETDITLTWETTFRDERTSTAVDDLLVSSQDTRDTEDIRLVATSGNIITIDDVDTNETVRAGAGELEVDVDVSSTDPDGLDGESLVLRANGNLVDIDDSPRGDSHSTTLTWEPRTFEVGSADVSVQILNSGIGETADVQVLRPLRSTLGDDDVPIDVDFDLISVG
ncbi:DUF7289 family protein [Halobacteriaceae archaeon SHR40]|uniref:DUF7289 family protein n=1 Tax=Halovenus amylolytica TaxID=2500550 RepID=UPI000FE33340